MPEDLLNSSGETYMETLSNYDSETRPSRLGRTLASGKQRRNDSIVSANVRLPAIKRGKSELTQQSMANGGLRANRKLSAIPS